MAAIESTGTRSKIKGQYENIKSLLGGGFFIASLFICKNKKVVVQKDEKGNSRSRKWE